jgi:hypothetical protein
LVVSFQFLVFSDKSLVQPLNVPGVCTQTSSLQTHNALHKQNTPAPAMVRVGAVLTTRSTLPAASPLEFGVLLALLQSVKEVGHQIDPFSPGSREFGTRPVEASPHITQTINFHAPKKPLIGEWPSRFAFSGAFGMQRKKNHSST